MSSTAQEGRPVDIETENEYSGAPFEQRARWWPHEQRAAHPIGIMDPSHPEAEATNFGIEGEMINRLRKLGLNGNESWLDTGCGDGRFLNRVISIGHTGRLIGVNYPAGQFMYGEFSNPDINFIEADARRLPFDSNSVDILTANHFYYHVERWREAAREAVRVLKPGGLYLVATRNPGHQQELWDNCNLIARGMQKKYQKGFLDIRKSVLVPVGDSQPPETGVDIRNVKVRAPKSFYHQFGKDGLDRINEEFRNSLELVDTFWQKDISTLYEDDWGYMLPAQQSYWGTFVLESGDNRYIIRGEGSEAQEIILRVIRPRYVNKVRATKVELLTYLKDRATDGLEISEEDRKNARKGYYPITIDQGFYIFRKKENSEKAESAELAEQVGHAAVL